VKDENGDLLADSHHILNRLKNYFSYLLKVHNVSDIGQIEIHSAELLVPGPSHLGLKLLLRSCKSVNRQVVIKFLQNFFKKEAKCYYLRAVWNKEELPDRWKESIIIPIRRKGDKAE
jgi:hypothetical protein